MLWKRRSKIAFHENYLWDNARMVVFAVVALIGLWYLVNSITNW